MDITEKVNKIEDPIPINELIITHATEIVDTKNEITYLMKLLETKE